MVFIIIIIIIIIKNQIQLESINFFKQNCFQFTMLIFACLAA